MKYSLRLLGPLVVTTLMWAGVAVAQPEPAAPANGTNSPATPPPNRSFGRGFGGPADQPSPRGDHNSQLAHEQLLEKAKKGGIDVYFEGDSITRRWGTSDYPELLANWKQNFYGWNAADFGWGADRVQNILWRLENGELDAVNPKVVVLLAGTNNVGPKLPADGGAALVADVTLGLKAILQTMQAKAPA